MTRGERGSATVLALVMVAALSTCAVVGVGIGDLLVAQRRAASAADLAALAGAETLRATGGSAVASVTACGEARRIAEANATRLSGCQVLGQEVVVETSLGVRLGFGMSRRVSGRARAGPG